MYIVCNDPGYLQVLQKLQKTFTSVSTLKRAGEGILSLKSNSHVLNICFCLPLIIMLIKQCFIKSSSTHNAQVVTFHWLMFPSIYPWDKVTSTEGDILC